MRADRPAPELWAWPIMPLDAMGQLQVRPAGWELTLGPIGDYGRPRWRPSPPRGPERGRLVRSVLLASASLAPYVVLPWAVRSQADLERLLPLLGEGGRPAASLVVPLVPVGYVVDSAREVRSAGYRLAAAGEPYLHRLAVDRLHMGSDDLVLLAPVPVKAQRPWLEEMAALGRGRIPTVARAVASRPLAAELRAAGVSHGTGTVLGRPLRTRLGAAGRREEG